MGYLTDMPAFADCLTEEDIAAVIAFIKSSGLKTSSGTTPDHRPIIKMTAGGAILQKKYVE